jgi:hypothetical protein
MAEIGPFKAAEIAKKHCRIWRVTAFFGTTQIL